jgi:uncharacterized membrane protein YfbV (UPF0208 family)
MTAPQVAMIALFALDLGISLAKHGETKTGKHSIWTSLFATALMALGLWWGGFWRQP